MKTEIFLDGESLTPEDLYSCGSGDVEIKFSDETVEKIKKSRKVIDDIVESGKVVYGVNTGFGKFADVVINKSDNVLLQKNLIRSHAAGTGEPLPKSLSRMILALRINVLAKGYSGISLENLEKMAAAFNSDCIPVVPCQGTVGASGDLAPLSHIALGLMGEGQMFCDDSGDICHSGTKIFRQFERTELFLALKIF